MMQWGKQLTRTLLAALSFIVFAALDFLDCVCCIVFAYLDELFDGDSASSCYCLVCRRTGNGVLNNGGYERDCGEVSETLYGDGRRNLFREKGWLRFSRRFEESKEKRLTERVNRWSDCGCESCLSWVKKDGNGLRLHVVVQEPETSPEVKSTENVVFLHGFICSSSFWTETVFCHLPEQRKKNLKLFAVDLLGFGRSPKPRDCLYTIRDHLEMIEKSVIFPFGLKSFHLVAHSMGSIVALALAAKHPESVKSVTLVAPPYFSLPRDGASSVALSKLAGKRLWPPLLFGASFMSWYEHLGRIVCFIICRNHRTWESILRLLTRRDVHFMITDLTRHTHHSAWHTMHNVLCGGAKVMDDYLEILSKRRVKITVIQGNGDLVVPLECSYNIKMKVPEADVRIIPRTDHITVVLNRTKEFAQDLEGIWSSCN